MLETYVCWTDSSGYHKTLIKTDCHGPITPDCITQHLSEIAMFQDMIVKMGGEIVPCK